MLFVDFNPPFRGIPHDYNVRVLRCKQPVFIYNTHYVFYLDSAIKDITGVSPLEEPYSRKQTRVFARFLMVDFLTRTGSFLDSHIASIIKKDRTTVIAARKKVADLLFADHEFKTLHSKVKRRIELYSYIYKPF